MEGATSLPTKLEPEEEESASKAGRGRGNDGDFVRVEAGALVEKGELGSGKATAVAAGVQGEAEREPATELSEPDR